MTTLIHRAPQAPGGVDWALFGRRHWAREPALLSAPPPLGLDRIHALTVESCAPFRAGTRFWVMPDVRFLAGDGWLRAPGTLLPGTAEPALDAYQDRLDADLAGQGYLLTVRQPLLLDHASWAAVRDAIRGLWRAVGWPNLPLVAEVLIGDRFTDHAGAAEPPSHAALTWVLRGRMDVRLWDERRGPPPVAIADPRRQPDEAPVLSAGAGELLYWPGDRRHVDTYRERCVALRLRIPDDRRLPFTALRDLLADLVHARQGHDESVPFFPFGPGSRVDGPGGVLPRLTALGDELRAVVDGEQLRRTMRVRWAALRSAAGLEPIPEPREGVPMTPETRIRRSGEIVRMPDGPGHEVWAVDGNVFTLPAAASDRLFAALGDGEEIGVAEVCRAAGAAGDDRNVLALLGRLYRLRGIEVVGDDGRAA
ncbi:hypothetical protein [Nonomuraea gerenzanensis]|uniref:Uncharacterized protein n=1 Tax=Nonomuraea gerenzanensis TaxID=93944 RepID=A0A1M4EFE9_9ACTN|nr:hypothetical protein [Nonomuraea gerenzanensis]UBU09016.1 hypothetical protein LCN96_32095 [Nonomuraea gerenzanensis]SBO97398.1 FIG01134492: hypothetical protein [Nonomuraea gerenzanensis]